MRGEKNFDEHFLKASIGESISPSDIEVIQEALSTIEGKRRELLQNYIKAEKEGLATPKILKKSASLESDISHINSIYAMRSKREKEELPQLLEKLDIEQEQEIAELRKKRSEASQQQRKSVVGGLLVPAQITMAVSSPHVDTTNVRPDLPDTTKPARLDLES